MRSRNTFINVMKALNGLSNLTCPPFSRKPTGQLFMSYRTHGDSLRDLGCGTPARGTGLWNTCQRDRATERLLEGQGYGTPARGAVHIVFIAQAFLWHQRFPCPPCVATWDVARWYHLNLRSKRPTLYFSSAPFLVALQVHEQSCLVTKSTERKQSRKTETEREKEKRGRQKGEKGRERQTETESWLFLLEAAMPGGFQMHGLTSSPFLFWLAFLLFTTKEDNIYNDTQALHIRTTPVWCIARAKKSVWHR